MGWLSSNGTPFSYRMRAPTANPKAAGDRLLTVPFPGWFLRGQSKVAQAAYQDVHVTTGDGTTELPCTLNAAKNSLAVDFASMPLGRTTLYVYYGHASAPAPAAACFNTSEAGGAVVDQGFEGRSQGGTPDSAIWSVDAGATVIYDHAGAPRTGSVMEMKVTTPAAAWGGAKDSVTYKNLHTDGAEVRFWHNAGQTNKTFALVGHGNQGAAQTFFLQFNPDTTLQVYNEQAGFTGYVQNGYTTLTTYATGWYEYRLVFNFSAHSFTLSRRTALGAAWTQIKAAGAPDYNIPMRVGTITRHDALLATGVGSAVQYLDQLQYSDSGISDTTDGVISQVFGANDERTSEEDTASRFYLWGEDLEATFLYALNPTTYYGAQATHSAGISAAGNAIHYLLKFFEGALPKGTVDEAKVHLYLDSTNYLENGTLKCHRMLPGGTNTNHDTYIRTGWTLQGRNSLPTWNNRFYSEFTLATRAWEAPGAVGANEVDLSDVNAPSLALTSGFAAGYQSFTLPDAWMTDWLDTDDETMGVLVKDATDVAGAANRWANIPAPSQANSPVLEVAFSALASDQFTNKKVSSDCYNSATFPTQQKYLQIPSANGFGVMMWANVEMTLNFAYLAPDGRMRMAALNQIPSGEYLNESASLFGLSYDPVEARFWVGINRPTGWSIGFSTPYLPTGWTWKTGPGSNGYKSGILARNGVCHCLFGQNMTYATYTRATDAWSATTTVVRGSYAGTMRTLAAQIDAGTPMTGAGEITLNGALDDYPTFGAVKIESEYFFYTGKNTGANKLTGVTRQAFGSAAALHSAGTLVTVDRAEADYLCMVHDEARGCFHAGYVVHSSSPNYAWPTAAYMRHYYADAASVWKDEANNALTLPIDQRNERVLNPDGRIAYLSNLALLSDGSLLAALLASVSVTSPGYSDLFFARLPNGETTWAKTDYTQAGFTEMSFHDAGSGVVIATGLDAATGQKTQRISSSDNGASWSVTQETLTTHTFADRRMWQCSATPSQSFDGSYGVMYSHDSVMHGTIYLDRFALAATGSAVARLFRVPFEVHQPRVQRTFRVPVEARRRIGHRYRLPFDTHIAYPVARLFRVPFTSVAGVGRPFRVPVDATGTTILRRLFHIPAEALGVAARVYLVPVEWESGRVRRLYAIPVEAGGGIGRAYRLELEAAGTIKPGRAFRIPVEILRRVERAFRIPAEAAGEEATSFLDTWVVRAPVRESFLDEWVVMPGLVVDFLEEWVVRSVMGGDFVDTWDVVPAGILTDFADDIQLPVGTVESD